eukprot:PhF_6_TR2296/c0_g1_i1/m.4020
MFVQRSVLQEQTADIMCLRYSFDDSLLGVGCYDGQFRCYNAKTGKVAYTLTSQMCDGAELKSSVTTARFRPGAQSLSRTIVALASGDGVSVWHVTTQRMQSSVHEKDNMIYALDYNGDGTAFVTGGKDCRLRVYDEDRMQLMTTLSAGLTEDIDAHTNRIQSIKWSLDDPNIIISGGWDNTVQIWDLRQNKSVRSIYGPYLCGDGLDMLEGTILCGSTRNKDNMEFFDFGTCKKIGAVTWPTTKNPDTGDMRTCEVFCASFGSRSSNLVFGCGTQDFKIFDRRTDRIVGGEVALVSKPLYACHSNRTDTSVAFGGAGGTIYLFDVQRAV